MKTQPVRRGALGALAILLLGIRSIAASDAIETPAATTPPVILGTADFCVTVIPGGHPDRAGMTPTALCRFDRLAHIEQVSRQKENYLQLCGLIDEFGISNEGNPGYNAARPGEAFLKIGLGLLIKKDDSPYDLINNYQVEQAFASEFEKTSESSCIARQTGGWRNWRYELTKTYQVDAARAEIHIFYQIRNTGNEPLKIEQYNHNFFRWPADHRDTRMKFDFPLKLITSKPDWMVADDRTVRVIRQIDEPVYVEQNRAVDSGSHEAVFTGGDRRIIMRGDFRPGRLAIYGDAAVICPEIVYKMEIAPGQQQLWRRDYTFTTP